MHYEVIKPKPSKPEIVLYLSIDELKLIKDAVEFNNPVHRLHNMDRTEASYIIYKSLESAVDETYH